MTATQQLVRAILDTLKEDIGCPLAWESLYGMARNGDFDFHESFLGGGISLGASITRNMHDDSYKPFMVWALCAFCAPTREGKSRIESIQVYDKYAELGYTDPVNGIIAVANWNACDKYDKETQTIVDTDDTIKLLGDLLDKLGCELEWEDEWTSCADCNGLVRTQPDGWDWQPHYHYGDGEIICLECYEPPAQEEEEEEPFPEDVCPHNNVREPSEQTGLHVGRQCLDCGVYLY